MDANIRLMPWLRHTADRALDRHDWAEFYRLRELAVIAANTRFIPEVIPETNQN